MHAFRTLAVIEVGSAIVQFVVALHRGDKRLFVGSQLLCRDAVHERSSCFLHLGNKCVNQRKGSAFRFAGEHRGDLEGFHPVIGLAPIFDDVEHRIDAVFHRVITYVVDGGAAVVHPEVEEVVVDQATFKGALESHEFRTIGIADFETLVNLPLAVDGRGAWALGVRLVEVLQHEDVQPLFRGAQRGGHARESGSYHAYLAVVRVGDISVVDGRGRRFPGIGPGCGFS